MSKQFEEETYIYWVINILKMFNLTNYHGHGN